MPSVGMYMKKIVFFLCFSIFADLFATNQERLYQDIRNKTACKSGEISSYLNQQGLESSAERVDCLEKFKSRAYDDNKPKLFDRLHEEILYENESWCKKHFWIINGALFFITIFVAVVDKKKKAEE